MNKTVIYIFSSVFLILMLVSGCNISPSTVTVTVTPPTVTVTAPPSNIVSTVKLYQMEKNVSLIPTFTFQIAVAVFYNIELSENVNSRVYSHWQIVDSKSQIQDNFYTPKIMLKSNTMYYWRLRANDGKVYTEWITSYFWTE
jgi:hypothetical protein